jgi:hypothetical protein
MDEGCFCTWGRCQYRRRISSLSSSRICSACLRSLYRIQYGSTMLPPQPVPHAQRAWIVVEGMVGRQWVRLSSALPHRVGSNTFSEKEELIMLLWEIYFVKKKMVSWSHVERNCPKRYQQVFNIGWSKNIFDEVSNHIKIIGKCYKRTSSYFTVIDKCFL